MTEPLFEDYSFWDRIGKERPVVLYGTGNGADKIIDALSERGIKPAGVFASDGFVRNRSFRGIRVSSYAETIEKLGDDITILLSFGTSRPDVMGFISELDKKHELIVPEMPLYGGQIFDRSYFRTNEKKIRKTYGLLADDYSKRLFSDTINFRLTGKPSYLSLCEAFEKSVSELFGGQGVKVVIDGGAYKGDTVKTFLGSLPDVETIIASEPDPGSFTKLKESVPDGRVKPVKTALSSSNGEVLFSSSSSRGAGISGSSKRSKKIPVEKTTVDSLLSGRKCDLIKLDVEGDEREALLGASETIKSQSPGLIVSLYHRTDDLFDVPEMIKELKGDYEFYLRRPCCLPMWDLNLFAIDRRRA